MFQPGDTIAGRRHRYTIERPLGTAGGESEELFLCHNGVPPQYVLKVFKRSRQSADREARLRWLVDQELWRESPAIVAPYDFVTGPGLLAHTAAFVPGETIETWWGEWTSGNVPFPLTDALSIAFAITKALAVLERRGISHGDLQSGNVLLVHRGTHWEVYLIDLDNFLAPNLPSPEMAGQEHYLAPEVLRGGALTPGAVGFSLFVLLHELVLLRDARLEDPAAREAFERAGRWILDPIRPAPGVSSDGYAAEVLDPRLMSLFRRGASARPEDRPTPTEWAGAFEYALANVYACEDCGRPYVLDAGKTACPYSDCRRLHDPLTLSWSGGQCVVDRGAVALGRADFGGNPHVSNRHLVLRRFGPEVRLEDVGSANGTARWDGATWTPLPKRKEVLLRRGDRLRVANVEVVVR